MKFFRAARTVSLLTLLSRITGLARELLLAIFFGASSTTDAFNIAFRLPNMLRRLFAEGAFTQAFVPSLASCHRTEGLLGARILVQNTANVLFWILLLTSAAGVIGAPLLVWLMANGLADSTEQLAIELTRIVFPYIGFMSLTALCAAILNVFGRFAVPAFTPVLLNLSMIAAIWIGSWSWHFIDVAPIKILAWGVVVGGALQFSMQLWALRKLKVGFDWHIGISWRPSAITAAWRAAGVQKVLRLMLPGLLGIGVAQISLLINTLIASHLQTGSVSWLAYADRLMEFPTALLGVSLGVILMPALSAARAAGDNAKYNALLDWGLRVLCMLVLPCALALGLCATALTATLYQHGAFTAQDSLQTARALQGYGVGLLGLVSLKILLAAYFANQDTRTPVRIAIAALILTQILNAVLVPTFNHIGLSWSIGLASLVNAAWLLKGLLQNKIWVPLPGWKLFLLRLVPAGLAFAVLVYWLQMQVDWLLAGRGFFRLMALMGVLGAGSVLYMMMLTLIGASPWQLIKRQ